MELHLSLNEIRKKFNLPQDVKIVICDDFPAQKQEELVTPDDFQPKEIKSLIAKFNDHSSYRKQMYASNIFYPSEDINHFINLMEKRNITAIESFCKSKGKLPQLVWKNFKDLL